VSGAERQKQQTIAELESKLELYTQKHEKDREDLCELVNEQEKLLHDFHICEGDLEMAQLEAQRLGDQNKIQSEHLDETRRELIKKSAANAKELYPLKLELKRVSLEEKRYKSQNATLKWGIMYWLYKAKNQKKVITDLSSRMDK